MKIIGFGDSITEGEDDFFIGYFQKYVQAIFPSIEIIDAGIGGNTSTQGLARIQIDVIDKNPDIVLVNFGKNDTWTSNVALSTYRSNMAQIFDALLNADITPIFWTTIPYAESITGSDGQNSDVENYNTAAVEEANIRGIQVIDVYSEFFNGDYPDLTIPLKADGIHPNDIGRRIISQKILAETYELIYNNYLEETYQRTVNYSGGVTYNVPNIGTIETANLIDENEQSNTQIITVQPNTAYKITSDGKGQVDYSHGTLEGQMALFRTYGYENSLTITVSNRTFLGASIVPQ